MAEKEKLAHKCVLCDSVLESKDALQLHFRKHANNEIKIKESSKKLKQVKKVIKDEKILPKIEEGNTIACDVCGQQFSNNAKAIQHKYRKHPDVSAKYLCPYCGMLFPIRALYDSHLDTHSSDLREKSCLLCGECAAEFYFQEALEYHVKATHKRVVSLLQPVLTPPPSKKINVNSAGEMQSVYFCHLCGCVYVVKFNLQEHLKTCHTAIERCTMPSDLIRCTTCDALFYNSKAYETHKVSHKPDDLYVTSEQQRLKTVSRVDQDFDIRRVFPLNEGNKYRKHKVKRKQKMGLKTYEDEELSPPSSPESDSDTDSDTPLAKLKGKINQDSASRQRGGNLAS